MEVMSALIPVLAAVFAALVTYVLLAARLRRQETDVVTAETRIRAESQADVARLEERIAGLSHGQMIKDEELQSLRAALGEARERLAALTRELQSEREQSSEKLALLQDARGQLTQQFQVLAQEILEEKSKRFSEQNQSALGQLLEPLKSRLQEFQGKVETAYVSESKDRSALAEQVKQLMGLNQQLNQRASDLTRALTSQNKSQGNWGELVLERVLEASGLRKGQEYEVQESHTREDGTRAQPDVVIHLPEGKHLIIDAKMSLNAYLDYANSDDETVRDASVKRHLDSVRTHIKGLSDKNYQELYGLKSLDFVLMFIPVEPAFMLATSHDAELWQDAWKRNVLLVSPSTLLFVVRTVAHLWRQEQQTRNAKDIAQRGAELYDKFVGFVEGLELVGTRLSQAQKAFDDTHKKLSSGRGSLVRQAEMLRELGVKPTKRLGEGLLDNALESLD
jgi:DNA recombination protein RmuC